MKNRSKPDKNTISFVSWGYAPQHVVETPTEKLCRTCGVVKTLPEFNRNGYKPDGRSSQCKSCNSARLREAYWRRKNAS